MYGMPQANAYGAYGFGGYPGFPNMAGGADASAAGGMAGMPQPAGNVDPTIAAATGAGGTTPGGMPAANPWGAATDQSTAAQQAAYYTQYWSKCFSTSNVLCPDPLLPQTIMVKTPARQATRLKEQPKPSTSHNSTSLTIVFQLLSTHSLPRPYAR